MLQNCPWNRFCQTFSKMILASHKEMEPFLEGVRGLPNGALVFFNSLKNKNCIILWAEGLHAKCLNWALRHSRKYSSGLMVGTLALLHSLGSYYFFYSTFSPLKHRHDDQITRRALQSLVIGPLVLIIGLIELFFAIRQHHKKQ